MDVMSSIPNGAGFCRPLPATGSPRQFADGGSLAFTVISVVLSIALWYNICQIISDK